MSEKDVSEISIIYDINEEDKINIFGTVFVDNNKNICKMVIDNKECELSEEYNVKAKNNKLKIKLKGINNATNMSYMFRGCSTLSSLPDISKLNTSNVICFVDAHHYLLYLIFQNGILIMLQI